MSGGIGSGRVTVIFDDGETYRGFATALSVGRSACESSKLELSMYLDNGVLEPAKSKETKKEKSKMTSQLSLYEYAVVLRAVSSSAALAGTNKDKLLIGPKAIMAKDAKEVERLAIREVSAEVDISMVEVFVRPFVTR